MRHQRPRDVELHFRGQESDRGGDACRSRQDHARNPELSREPASVHRSRPPEGDERQITRIPSALDRHDSRGEFHVGRHDLMNAPRRRVDTEPQGTRHALVDRAGRGVRREPHGAAGEVRRIEIPENEVRVGDGRLGPAALVADRAGGRRRALRAHGDHAQARAGDRAAARADLYQVDRLDVHRQPAAGRVGDPVQLERRRRERSSIGDERQLRRRAAHVEGDQLTVSGQFTVDRRHQRARGGPGFDHAHGMALERLRRRHAAGRLHDVEASAIAALPERVPERREILAERRHHVGVHHGRRRPLVFAKRGRHLVRERDRDVRRFLGHDRGEPPLVNGVHVRVQETDGERGDAPRDEFTHRAAGVGLVERCANRAVGEDALGDLADESPRDQRARLLDLEVVDLVALLATDDQHVAKATRRQKPDAARLALDHDVRAEGGAVDRLRDVLPGDAGAADQVVQPRETRRGRIRIGREPLACDELAARRLDYQVGERAADVESHPIRHAVRSGVRGARAPGDTGTGEWSGR